MNDDTFQHSIPRPGDPKPREHLPRMSDSRTWITMPKGKGNLNKRSKNDRPSTPPDSKLNKHRNFSSGEDEFRNQQGTPGSLSYSSTSTSETSINQSLSDSVSSNLSALEKSSEKCKFLDKSSTSKVKLSYEELKRVDASVESSGPEQNNWSYIQLVGTLSIIAVSIWICTSLLNNPSVDKNDSSDKALISKIRQLKSLFPSQDKDIWRQFGTGIGNVQSKAYRPAIFLLIAVHDETANCLAKEVAELARSVLSGTGDVVLTPDKLENNISKVLDLVETRINRTKAMVVSDLLSIEPEALRAFHDICDPYNPLVAEAVYVFTMSSGVQEENTGGANFAEKQLTNKFSDTIIEDTLKALIVRITAGAVLTIKEEEHIPCYD